MMYSERRNGSDSALLKKGLSILLCFSNPPRPLSQSEIAKCTGLPMSTAARLLQVLLKTGFLERNERTALFGYQWRRWRCC